MVKVVWFDVGIGVMYEDETRPEKQARLDEEGKALYASIWRRNYSLLKFVLCRFRDTITQRLLGVEYVVIHEKKGNFI